VQKWPGDMTDSYYTRSILHILQLKGMLVNSKAIYLTKRGKIEAAREILDAFLHQLLGCGFGGFCLARIVNMH